jgi:hypothetical protein
MLDCQMGVGGLVRRKLRINTGTLIALTGPISILLDDCNSITILSEHVAR